MLDTLYGLKRLLSLIFYSCRWIVDIVGSGSNGLTITPKAGLDSFIEPMLSRLYDLNASAEISFTSSDIKFEFSKETLS